MVCLVFLTLSRLVAFRRGVRHLLTKLLTTGSCTSKTHCRFTFTSVVILVIIHQSYLLLAWGESSRNRYDILRVKMRKLWLLTFLWRILLGGCQSLLLVRRAWYRVHLAVLDHLDKRFIFRLLSVSNKWQVFDRGRDTLRLDKIIDHCIDRNDVLTVRAGGLVSLQWSSIQDVFYHGTCWFWLLYICSPTIKSRCPLTWLKCLRSLSRLFVTLVVIENSIFICLTLRYLFIWINCSSWAYWASVCYPNTAPFWAREWIFIINRRFLELFQVFLFVILLGAWNFECWQISCYTRVGSVINCLCSRSLHFCKSLIDSFLVLEI